MRRVRGKTSQSDVYKRVVKQIKFNYEWLFKQGNIEEPHKFQVLKNPKLVRSVASLLIERREYRDPDHRVDFFLLDLEEIKGGPVPFVFCIPTALNFLGEKNQGDCFVGCRFTGDIKHKLNHNLVAILSYYGFEVRFSDTGADARQVFDNRATERKPNVYIEIGTGYAKKRPFVIFEYTKGGTTQLPTDLAGFLTLRYSSSYQELFQEFSLMLPRFLKDHNLITPPAPRSRRRLTTA
jgi:hypothetical protein